MQSLTPPENVKKNKLTDAPFMESHGDGSAVIFGPDGAWFVEPLPSDEQAWQGIPYANSGLSIMNE